MWFAGTFVFPLALRYVEEMTVSRKTLRMFMCAAVATVLGAFGPASQATFVNGDFDPDTITGHFTGHFVLNVSNSCNSESCNIDLVSLIITGSGDFGSGWFSAGQLHIASSASFVGGLHFSSVVIPLSNFNNLNFTTDFVSAGFGRLDPTCGTPSLQFTRTFSTDFAGHPGFIADLGCFNNEFIGDNAIYVIVPEPGTFGLLVGGIGAAWLTRRRKTTA